MVRREFLRMASAAVAGAHVRAGWTLQGEVRPEGGALPETALLTLFRDPPMQYRPMVRWWWNGDRVVSEEILRELDVLQGAGIGGVEINPIRLPAEAEAGGTTALEWMSDAWLDALGAALRGTKERGMTCDMIVGSGWPYGGEFLPRADQTQMMALGTRDVTGPQQMAVPVAELLQEVSPQFVSPYRDPLKELIALVLVPYALQGLGEVTAVAFAPGDEAVRVDVPAGRHVLYFLVKLTGFMAVINGAPGASGPVLNHYSAPAVSRYLDRISDRLVARFGPLRDHFRAFFTDSIELEGENWCDDMLAQFAHRCGYDLLPFLPFVLFKVGEMGNPTTTPYGAQLAPALEAQVREVRYDFETTKRALFRERFIETFAAWCTRHGVLSRMQAYGMDCDPITSSILVDIPECETWLRAERVEAFAAGDYARGRDYTVVNKLVASGAHLAGKRLVSCEEMTNTDDPFHISLHRLKVAGDENMLTGVTQSVLHGFNYSPPSIAFPGWVRYGTYFSEHNTWWPYFKLWTAYKARLYAVLQHAEMQADIAVLAPSADLAAQYGFQRDPFPRVVEPAYLYRLWEVVQQNGGGCDYVAETIIEGSRVEGGRLVYGSRRYRAVLLAEVVSMQPATAQKLRAFAAAGGTVVFLNKLPVRAAGFLQHARESEAVNEAITAMQRQHAARAPLVEVDEADMVGWYGGLQRRLGLRPAVAISKPTDFVSQIHYRAGGMDLFFFTHYGPGERVTFQARFDVPGRYAWLWNAEDGSRAAWPQTVAARELLITLGPAESKLIVFDDRRPESGDAMVREDVPPAGAALHAVEGPWRVRLESVDGSSRSVVLEELADMDRREDLRSFAGTIFYSKQVELAREAMPRWLRLGVIHAVSQVRVNGKDLGTRWYGDQVYDLSGAVHAGSNALEIAVTTTLGSYAKSLKGNRTAQAWTAGTPDYPLGLEHVWLIDGR